jgi:teichuronic acid biosynthesis glycosyltransferase TuaG
MKEPLVSIIMPSYNSMQYISTSINSVINQTYENWELIIVDDCSIDGSSIYINNLLQDLQDFRIKYLKQKVNKGAAESRNIAMENASGKFIAFLDSDDVWDQNKLKLQMEFMIENDFDFTYHNYSAFDSKLEKVLYNVKCPSKINYNSYAKNTIIGCLTVIFNKTKFDNYTMPIIKSSHDMALWLKLLRYVEYAHCLELNLAKYRVLSNSNSSSKYKASLDVWRVYRNIEKINVAQSIYFFVNYLINALKKRVL